MLKLISQCPMPIQCASVYVLGTKACATHLRSYIDVLIGGVMFGSADILAIQTGPYRERIKENILSNLYQLTTAELQDMHVGYVEEPDPRKATPHFAKTHFLTKDIEYYKYLHALLLLLEPDGTSQSYFRNLCSFDTKKTETLKVVKDSGNLKPDMKDGGISL